MKPETVNMLDELSSLLVGLDQRLAVQDAPSPTSHLGQIDRIWPYSPPSETLRSLSIVGSQHLRLSAHLVGQPALSAPAPVYSLLRVCLVSVCRAFWIVLPTDKATAQSRALAVTASNYRHARDYHLAERDRPHANTKVHDQTLHRLDSRITSLNEVRERLPATPSRESQIVEAVAREFEVDAGKDLRAMYQYTSSSVHAYTWGAHVRPGMTKVTEDPTRQLVGYSDELDTDHVVGELHLLTSLLDLADKRVDQWSHPN